MSETAKTFESWAILELMGHRRVAGFVTEQTIGGAAMLRVDMPAADGQITQFYSGSSVYCMTPCTEEVARLIAGRVNVRPAWLLELPPPREPSGAADRGADPVEGFALEDDRF